MSGRDKLIEAVKANRVDEVKALLADTPALALEWDGVSDCEFLTFETTDRGNRPVWLDSPP